MMSIFLKKNNRELYCSKKWYTCNIGNFMTCLVNKSLIKIRQATTYIFFISIFLCVLVLVYTGLFKCVQLRKESFVNKKDVLKLPNLFYDIATDLSKLEKQVFLRPLVNPLIDFYFCSTTREGGDIGL